MRGKERIDVLLYKMGHCESRTKAEALIRAGKVYINNELVTKPGRYYRLEEIKEIKIVSPPEYVSRGGIKLAHALKVFNIDVKDRICMDVGASTGGFTDCLLKHGAKRVYAIDVGYGIIHEKLRTNPKVILFERTNVRYITEKQIPEKVSIITIDVSFISVRKFLIHLLDFVEGDFDIILLFKPQFEGKPEYVKKGIVKDKEIHLKLLNEFTEWCNKSGIIPVNITYSPIKGSKGNIEYFFHLKREGISVEWAEIKAIINRAWEI